MEDFCKLNIRNVKKITKTIRDDVLILEGRFGKNSKV